MTRLSCSIRSPSRLNFRGVNSRILSLNFFTDFGRMRRERLERVKPGYLALGGGTIYVSPSEEPIRNGVVIINEGKIAAVGTRGQSKIPQSAQLIDCSGRTITAGFWNSHVHFLERKWANAKNIPADELLL